MLEWKDKCVKGVCVRTCSAGPHGNAGSVIELCYNYPEEIILTYSLCVRKKLSIIHLLDRVMVLDGALSLSLFLFPFACIVLLKYDGPIFILSQWQLMGLFSCGPGGWWNSKQTFFLRRRRVLHHSGWGRHRHLCCLAVTGGYGIQYTWPPPLNTESLCSTVSLLCSFFCVTLGSLQHHIHFVKC